MKNTLTSTIVISLAVGLVGFYAGTKYQQSKMSTGNGARFMMRAGQDGPGNGSPLMRGQGNRVVSRPTTGEIMSADADSITVKMADGGSKIILLNDTTMINQAEVVEKTALTTGTSVMIFGQENADGSITAQSIQLNPANTP